MNIREMQYEFGIQLNQMSEALQLESDDIEYWLNKAQLELVKQKYNGFNQLQRGFEQSQQRVDDLRVLLERDVELTTSFDNSRISAISNYYVDKVEFPQDYMFLLSQKSLINYKYPEISYDIVADKREASGDFKTKVVYNRKSLTDKIYNLLSDPFNVPKPSSPLTVITEDNIFVFTDKTFIVDKVFIDYLRLPRKMSIEDQINSELPEHLHYDIIQRAVDLFLSNTRNLKQRLQNETPTADKQQIEEDNE